MEADKKFWETMNILVEKECRKTERELMEDVRDWVDKVVAKKLFSESLSIGEAEEFDGSKIKNKDQITSGYVTADYDDEIKQFLGCIKLPKIECKFRHPLVTSRLEKLMGSNIVSLTDRDYMQQLQNRILVNYALSVEKRIKVREMNEMERVKNLVLTGKVPFSEAPPEMYDHPVMVIERYCQKLIAERRAKIKVPKVYIPNHLYWDDTIDPPSGLTIEKGHIFRGPEERVCKPPDRFIDVEDEVDIENGYMLEQEIFDSLKYEDPLIKELKECQNVDEIYTLADEVIGILKTFGDSPQDDALSKMTALTGFF